MEDIVNFPLLSWLLITSFLVVLVDTASVRNMFRGQWYLFDDSRVSESEDVQVIKEDYY